MYGTFQSKGRFLCLSRLHRGQPNDGYYALRRRSQVACDTHATCTHKALQQRQLLCRVERLAAIDRGLLDRVWY